MPLERTTGGALVAAVATIVAAVVGVTILVAKRRRRRRRQPDDLFRKDSWDVSTMIEDSDTEVDQIPACEEMDLIPFDDEAVPAQQKITEAAEL